MDSHREGVEWHDADRRGDFGGLREKSNGGEDPRENAKIPEEQNGSGTPPVHPAPLNEFNRADKNRVACCQDRGHREGTALGEGQKKQSAVKDGAHPAGERGKVVQPE